VSIGSIGVVKDSKGSRLIYIKYVEGLGSPKATPNLDVESRGPNHTTIIVPFYSLLYHPGCFFKVIIKIY